MKRVTQIAATALVGLVLTGCGNETPVETADAPAMPGGVLLEGAGATFPKPLYDKWIEVYTEAHPKVDISYDGIGSGGGIAVFLAEEVDFGASDAAMSDAALGKVGARGAVMVPMTAGMVVLAYNIPGVDEGLRLPRDVVADIFAGNLRYWDDPRIEEANPGETLPHRGITPVVRRDSSGTTFTLTNFLSAANDWWREEGPGVGKQVDWPGPAMQVNYNSGVAQRVKLTEGSIGYMEYEFGERLGLPIAILENKAGAFIKPSPAAGTAALASIEAIPDNLRVFAPDPSGADAYPIVTYTWLLLYGSYPDADKAQALKDWVAWALAEGQAIAEEMGYIPLPAEMVRLAEAKVEAID